jgi:hypothetical protein
MPGSRREVEVDEACAGDFGPGDQRRGGQGIQNQLREFARIALERPRQLHGGIAGEITVRRVLRAFEFERERGVRGYHCQCILQ